MPRTASPWSNPDGGTVSYAELAARADQYGRGLQALGLRPGDCVAGMLPNSTEALALFFAAIQTGLYVVPVNWHLAAAEVAYILSDSGAAAFVAHERFAAVAAEAAELAGIKENARFAVGEVPGFTPLAALGAASRGGTGRPEPRTAGAPMVYTSGTSGRPKGVRRPLTGEDPDQPPLAAGWFFGIFGLKPFDGNVHLCCSPLYHTAVLNFATISLQVGHPVILMDRFDAGRAAEAGGKAPGDPQPHGADPVPPSPRAAGRNQGPLRRVLVAVRDPQRRPLPAGRQAADAGLVGPGGDRVLRGQRGRRHRDHRRAVAGAARFGRPALAGFRRSLILDEDGSDVPAGQTGLVYMRMGTSTFDYYKDEEKTLASRARGMFTVGDIGYLDADGYLFLCDRKSDMIISGGVNIYPAEIESALSAHPAVDDVAVFGIPHEEWGEEIKAVVQPAPAPSRAPR